MQRNRQVIYRFISDRVMSEEVKTVLLDTFMKKREGDVHTKAAQMLAIDMLHEGWKELERYNTPLKKERKPVQPGV